MGPLDMILSYPVFLLSLIALAFVSSSLLYSPYYDHKRFSFNYDFCLNGAQWWRLLTSSFCHSSILHLLIDLLTLWDVRSVEKDYGSLFFLRYSLLFLCAQKLLLIFFFQFGMKYWPQITPLLSSFHIIGTSGLIFSWLGFLAVRTPSEHSVVQVFGLIPLNILYVPTLLLLLYQIILPRSPNNIGCLSGLICGVLLGVGLLQVLPNLYWTLCFLLNLFLFIGKSWYETMTISGNHRHTSFNRIEIRSAAGPVRNAQLIIDQQQTQGTRVSGEIEGEEDRIEDRDGTELV
jgi:membrane associated rhomboid family serine protease